MESKHMLDKKIENKSKFPSTNRVLLDKFTVLAEGNDQQRLQETKQLLFSLQKLQSAYKQSQKDGLCTDVEYALSRLIKGLASNRKWARIGFATALTQLISSIETIEVKNVLKRIEDTLTCTQQETKWEKGQVQFGKATAMLCLIRSGRLQPDSGEELKAIVDNLNQIKSKKTYLLLPCVYGLEQLLLKVDKSTFEEHVLPAIKEQLTCGWDKCDPNTLLLLLTCQKKGLIDSSFLKTYWETKSLLDSRNWEKVTKIVLASANYEILLHHVHEVMLEEIKRTGVSLFDMWNENLVALCQPGKKRVIYLGLYYLRAVVQTLTSKDQVLEVFSFEVCQMFHKNLIIKDKVWREMAKGVADELVQLFISLDEKHLQVSLLRHFLSHHVTFKDSQFFKELLRQLKPEEAVEYSVDLMKIVKGDNLKESVDFQSDIMKCWAITELKSIISKSEVNDGQSSLLEFFLLHSVFNVNAKAKGFRHVTPLISPLSEHVRNLLRDAFSTLLGTLQQPGRKDLNSVLSVSYKLARYAESLLSEKSVSLIKELPEEAVEELSRSLDMVAKIQKKSSPSPDIQAFEILFLHLSFQMLIDPSDGLDIVQDVHVCFEKSQKKPKKASKNEDEEPDWMDVMTELLISLEAKKSKATRSVANHVFRLLSPHVTKSSLDLIINVLVPGEDEDADEGPITFQDNDDDSEEDETIEKPGQTVNGIYSNQDGDEVNKDGSSDESEESDDESSDEEGKVNEQLRQTVKAALGPAAASSDEEEESDEGMGDEEMFRIDDALSEAFRAMQKGKSKDVKVKKEQLVTFKLRTLDLLETFVRTNPPTGLLVHLVSPLLDLMESGLRHKEDMNLGKRAKNNLQYFALRKKVQPDPDLDQQEVLEKMEQLIEYSTKVSGLHMVNEVSGAFFFLLKAISQLPVDVPAQESGKRRKTRSSATSQIDDAETQTRKPVLPEKVISMLKKALSDCLNRKDSRLHHMFFRTILQKYSRFLWPLSEILLDCLNRESVRVFLRTQAASLLSLLLMGDLGHIKSSADWPKFVSIFTKTVTKILLALNEDNYKPKYTHELLILVTRFINVDKENGEILREKLQEKLQSLHSKLPKDSKQACNKILSQIQKSDSDVNRKKKKRLHQESDKLDETETVIKSPKLSDNGEMPSPKKNKKKERRKSINLTSSVNGDEVMSDSSAPPLQREAEGEVTPKKKKKSKNESDVDVNSQSQDSSDSSIKRKVTRKRTPRKKSS